MAKPSRSASSSPTVIQKVFGIRNTPRLPLEKVQKHGRAGSTWLIDRQSWATRRQAQLAINHFIGGFYNRQRRHSYLGHLTPSEYEQRYEEQLRTAA